jgi:transposase
MNSLVYVGADVHNESYSLIALLKGYFDGTAMIEDKILWELRVSADPRNIVKFIEAVRKRFPTDANVKFVCGYEAGGLGFSLQRALAAKGIECRVIAPTTLPTQKGKKCIKTDRIDARIIAKAMADGNLSYVHVPTEEDESVVSYIRARDDHRDQLTKVKQQIVGFCNKHGYHYDPSKAKWTHIYMKWLLSLKFEGLDIETMSEYMDSYYRISEKLERMNQRIEEIAEGEKYRELVKRLCCIKGIKTYTAMALIAEVSDFRRFEKAPQFAAFLGLVPGQHTTGSDQKFLPITKAGNRHLRTLLIEAAQAACQGHLGYKSKALKARQNGESQEVIAYADKCSRRVYTKYRRLMERGKTKNIAIVAVARELAEFIWGMAMGKIMPAA